MLLMQPPDLKLIKIDPCCGCRPFTSFPNYLSIKQTEIKNSGFCRLCFKLLPPTILTSSLSFYPYQKDERALPGYLLTRRSFFSPPDIKRLSLSPRTHFRVKKHFALTHESLRRTLHVTNQVFYTLLRI
jgi:hypothetical protein